MATASAVCHHVFLNSVNGKQADKQLQPGVKLDTQSFVSGWSIFLEKCTSFFLTTAIGFAFVSLLWRRLKDTAFKPAEIDAAFSVPRNITSIVVLRKAPKLWFVTLIGIIAWLVPIASLTTPGSLTTKLTPWKGNMTFDVFVVDYERAPPYRRGVPFNDSWMIMDWDDDLDTLPTPRFTSEMPQLDNIARQVLAQQAFTPWQSPCPGNCTFPIDLQAPGLQCNLSDVGWMEFFDSCNAPTCFLFSSLYNSTAALERSMWTNETYMERDRWQLMWTNGSATCVLTNMSYPLEITFLEKSNRPSIRLSSAPRRLNLLADVMDSYNPNINRRLDGKFWANYHQVSLALAVASSMGTTFVDYYSSNDSSKWGPGGVMFHQEGVHLVSNQSYALAATFVQASNGANVPNQDLLRMTNVIDGLNELMLNLSMSLIGTAEFQTTRSTTCSVTTFVQAFNYNPWVLWRAYLPALVVGLGIVVAGVIVIQQGGAAGSSFSDFAGALKVGVQSARLLLIRLTALT
jgi:hypothetical protein